MAKRIRGRNASLFYALEREKEAPDGLKYEYHRRSADRALESLMDCRHNNKTEGEHGFIARPANPVGKMVRDVSVPKGILLCRSGATIEHDQAKMVRYLVFQGNIVGKLRHSDVIAIRAAVPMKESRKAGTNIIVYEKEN